MTTKTILAIALVAALSACSTDADVASHNLSKAADQFEVQRRVVFYNGFNGEYILTVEGLCSLDASSSNRISIVCKVGPTDFKKHYLGLSDNVTYFIEQMDPVPASVYRYRVVFKPSAIVPAIEVK